jgi:hypothetical protein
LAVSVEMLRRHPGPLVEALAPLLVNIDQARVEQDPLAL